MIRLPDGFDNVVQSTGIVVFVDHDEITGFDLPANAA
jgi:hypothetical protein